MRVLINHPFSIYPPPAAFSPPPSPRSKYIVITYMYLAGARHRAVGGTPFRSVLKALRNLNRSKVNKLQLQNIREQFEHITNWMGQGSAKRDEFIRQINSLLSFFETVDQLKSDYERTRNRLSRAYNNLINEAAQYSNTLSPSPVKTILTSIQNLDRRELNKMRIQVIINTIDVSALRQQMQRSRALQSAAEQLSLAEEFQTKLISLLTMFDTTNDLKLEYLESKNLLTIEYNELIDEAVRVLTIKHPAPAA